IATTTPTTKTGEELRSTTRTQTVPSPAAVAGRQGATIVDTRRTTPGRVRCNGFVHDGRGHENGSFQERDQLQERPVEPSIGRGTNRCRGAQNSQKTQYQASWIRCQIFLNKDPERHISTIEWPTFDSSGELVEMHLPHWRYQRFRSSGPGNYS